MLHPRFSPGSDDSATRMDSIALTDGVDSSAIAVTVISAHTRDPLSHPVRALLSTLEAGDLVSDPPEFYPPRCRCSDRSLPNHHSAYLDDKVN